MSVQYSSHSKNPLHTNSVKINQINARGDKEGEHNGKVEKIECCIISHEYLAYSSILIAKLTARPISQRYRKHPRGPPFEGSSKIEC